MSTKNSSSLFLCASLHYSSIPAFHYSILKNVTGWSRVWHGLKTFKRPLLILGCHDVTTWSTLRRGGFLGFSVRLRKSPKGRWYVHREPHPKSCQKFRDAVRELLNHWTLHLPIEDAVQQLNRKVSGWANYFDYGNNTKAFQRMQLFVNQRLRRWLWRKGAGTPTTKPTPMTNSTAYVTSGHCPHRLRGNRSIAKG